jgi:endonuclease/exonuclease/phosphatase family metal-dependent hydrolase
VIANYAPTVGSPPDRLAVVSWNTHVGGGDVRRLAEDLRRGDLTGGRPVTAFALLLQEVYRAGDQVPAVVPEGAQSAGFANHTPNEAARRDIESIARALQLHVFYAPSMRNGKAADPPEDRGNAILSTLPLTGYRAVELPVERQRRVAVEASIELPDRSGRTTSLRLASVHLTNTVAHHLWMFSEAGRWRQARSLAATIENGPILLGGDFNTWFGSWDAAYREMARHADTPRGADHRDTFMFLRLDHFFYRLPQGWSFSYRRAESRYGSDHYPLVGELRLPTYD